MTAEPQTKMQAATDIDEAREFLDIIAPGTTDFTFQTFTDAKGGNDRLAHILHGTLDENIFELRRLSKLGAGVFVALNQTDGQGRKIENIKAVRAVMLDLDGAPIEPVYDCPLKPHVIVESSPGRWHAYWRVTGLHLDQFVGVQHAIAAHFDGDPAVGHLDIVARLPGFLHQKGDPFMTHIVDVNDGPAYSAEKILAEFAPLDKPHKLGGSMVADRVHLDHNAPAKWAEALVKARFWHHDQPTLKFYRAGFYEWAGSHYLTREKQYIEKAIYEFLSDAITIRSGKDKPIVEPVNPDQAKVGKVVHALKAGVYVNGDVNQPVWSDGRKDPSPERLIACKNGLVDMWTEEITPHTPAFFNVNALPFDFDPKAPKAKRWLKFLDEIWPDDPEAIATLQEIFGLCLTTDTSFEKIFMLVGPARSGKGTISHVLEALLGSENVAHPTMAHLGESFGLWQLIDKPVAIFGDVRIGAKSNLSATTERLLGISSRDVQSINRKDASYWVGRLQARLIMLSNELPFIADSSGVLAKRFIILKMKQSFYGREDRHLADKLMKEAPSIMLWALDGLDRLYERGHFLMPASGRAEVELLAELASPVQAFIAECCVTGPEQSIRIGMLHDAYCWWMDGRGRKGRDKAVFGKELHSVLPHLTKKGRIGPKQRYVGIALNEEADAAYDRAWSK